MKFREFCKKFNKYQIITYNDLIFFSGSYDSIKNNINRWRQEGKIIQLKKGFYTLSNEYRPVGLSLEHVSNRIYTPSYVSLEYALSYFYKMIPEVVYEVTAISTNKTASFTNNLGRFSYRNIKKEAFCGYNLVPDEYGIPVLIATREKALLDKMYFEKYIDFHKTYFLENMRLQNYEGLNIRLLQSYIKKWKSQKLQKMLPILINLIKKDRKQ